MRMITMMVICCIQMDPLSIVAYIMATIVLAMALMLYYYVAYTHF